MDMPVDKQIRSVYIFKFKGPAGELRTTIEKSKTIIK